MSALPPEADIRVAHTAALLKRLVQDAPPRLQAAALLALGRPALAQGYRRGGRGTTHRAATPV